jgi:exoribonuclease R
MVLAGDGSLQSSDLYQATVRNRAKLAYNSVAGWLEGNGPMPQGIGAVSGLDENLRLQDRVAQKLKALRHLHGALDLETIEARPVFDGDELKDLEADKKNRAKDIIEDFMIAANGVTARYLASKKFPSLRRVVRIPKRWDRIVELAAERGSTLPKEPDAKALEQFLVSAKAADPLRFPDLSLSVIKLLGAGEYVVQLPGGSVAGHFGLAVKDYAHSTAPNRRYPDLITQRLLKASVAGVPGPTRMTNWKRSPSTAPKRKTQRKKWNGRSQNPRPQLCWKQGLGSSSMPSSPAPRRKARGSVFYSRPLKEDWSAGGSRRRQAGSR